MDRTPMTPDGYKKLVEELRHLKSVERAQNIRDIETAREHGDLKENAEYHAAKEKQSLLDARIRSLESQIASAEVIDPALQEHTDKILFGARVTLLDLETELEVTYTIVGDEESSIKDGKIAISSPIARGLIGKRQTEQVNIKTPKGVREFEIIEVKYLKVE